MSWPSFWIGVGTATVVAVVVAIITVCLCAYGLLVGFGERHDGI